MNAKIILTLTHDEIQRTIPYAMICETRFGRYWETGKRLTRWRAEFTPRERVDAEKLFRLAYAWYLKTGVPESVEMTAQTLALWKRIETFCASL